MKSRVIVLTLAMVLLISANVVRAKGNPEPKTKRFQQTIKQLEKAKEKTRDPRVDDELEVIETETATSDAVIEDSLPKVENRPQIYKLIIGPDYKNAGQVRSQIVHLQNQVRKLDRLGLSDAAASLSSELSDIQASLAASLNGVSLFGWLTKFLSGYTLPVTPTPTPTITPSVTITPVPTL